ncbi:hypothetical protein GCM10010885_06050 [Alicyclobacillus cellulosilyticus]|uniref:Uncharacterized protein n=1 Tax=Alicyclobacillus cellulosilyticus TaxID=1003997 RepID=A0A917K635_9BACL|nr:hypothetical protein [Alicyclobacillus cellulosilyticus]GGI99564.1 hypothetical protein GCM10010885_06050 [Alicyclobacillus cellulosilyticus]
MIYWYGREKIDVFIDAFQMCHRIDFAHRLELQPVTLPLADLALTKLQIVEFTEKDIKDTLALILASDWAERDEPGVFNVARFAEVLAGDWGLWKTVTNNLHMLERHAESLLQGDAPALAKVRDGIRRLREATDARRKSWRWRLRAVIGERVRWYELPEEP